MSNAIITRIVAIRDTREYEEIGDKWVAIPGSGNSRKCDRCSRDHEVHVDVELSDGSAACIGSGCATGETMAIKEQIRTGVATAKRRARLERELVAARATLAAAREAERWANALPLPEIKFVETIESEHGNRQREVWACHDAVVWCFNGLDNERRQSLEMSWRRLRFVERLGKNEYIGSLINIEADITRRLGKIANGS